MHETVLMKVRKGDPLFQLELEPNSALNHTAVSAHSTSNFKTLLTLKTATVLLQLTEASAKCRFLGLVPNLGS